MDGKLHRFWITFASDTRNKWNSFGYGVTGYDETDALAILQYVVFTGETMPDVLEVLSDVDVRDLDQGHVVPNMAPPNLRGVWYPRGFDTAVGHPPRTL